MKKFKFIGFLALLMSSLFFIQCTTDTVVGPVGADGTNGVNGIDGVDGINGVDGVGTASCVACHSNSHREPIYNSYALSGHGLASANSAHAASSASCTECHSNEGFVNYITGETAVAIDEPSPISCTTCHNEHSTFDFENDGFDYALRSFSPVKLRKLSHIDYTIDYGNTSNACIECHQPRRTFPVDDGTGIYNVPSHYGPHYGAQSTMLEGIEGAEIAGSVAYPTAVSSTHRNGASCVSCHMGETTDDSDGQHTMVPTLNTCATCHGDAETLKTNLQMEVTELMTTLEGLLIDNGILDTEGELVTGDHPVALANAYWNWEYVYQDHSKGVHNPAYTRALLKNSIELLQP